MGQEHSAVYSPDGTKIAFVRETAGNADVYVVNADGTGLQNVSDDSDDDLNPAWMPDSAAVVFDSNRTGLRQVYKVSLADTGTTTRLTNPEWENYEPTVSPDGTWVAHATSEPNVPDEFLLVQIWKTHITTKSIAPLTQTNPGKNRNPEWSPDGTKIVFSSNRATGTASADYDVWVMDAAGDNEVAVTSGTDIDDQPRWVTHDGRGAPRVLYTSNTELKMVDVAGTNAGVVLDDVTSYRGGDMQPLPGCSIVWDGSAAANDWDDPENWDLGRVPQAGDKVCIPDLQTGVTIVQSTGNPVVDSITTYEDLTISGGWVTSPVVTAMAGADIRVVGGVLAAATNVTAADGSFTVAGGTANIGSLTSTGTGALALTSGTLNTTSIAPATTMSLNGGQLNGPVSLASGTFTMPSSGPSSDGDPWTIAAGATLDLTSAAPYWLYGPTVNNGTVELNAATSFVNGSGTATLSNGATGTMTKDAANSTTSMGLPFDNDGLLDVVAGTVSIAGDDGATYAANNDAGTFNTDGDDATVSFAGGRTNLGSATALTGTGRFELVGTSTILDLDTHGLTLPAGQTLHLTAGALRGTGTLAGPTYKLSNSVTLGAFTIDENTTVDLTNSAPYYFFNSLVNDGTINLNTATSFVDGTGSATVTNSATGRIVKNAANSTTSINLGFDNDGLLDVQAGTVSLYGSDGSTYADNNDAGTFNADGDDATISFAGGRTNLGSATALTGTGRFELVGTSTILDLDTHGLTMPVGPTMHLSAGTLQGSGTLAGPRYELTNAATLGTFSIHPDTTLDLVSTGPYYLYASLVNDGTIEINSATGFIDGTGSATLTNTSTGKMVKDVANSTTSINLGFDNDGLLDVQAGTVNLYGNDGSTYADNNDAGTFNTDGADATISFAGGRTNLGSATALTGSGRFELTGNSTILDLDTHGLTLPEGQTLHLSAGSLRGSGTLAGPTYKMTNAVTLGAFTIGGDTTLELTDSAPYYFFNSLVNDGTINLKTATGIIDGSGFSTLTNNGTVVKDATNSTTNVSIPFDNVGTVRVTAGTLSLPGTLLSNGTSAWNSTTGTLTGGTYEVAGTAELRFTGTMEILTNAAQFQLGGTGIVTDGTGGSVFRNLTTNQGMLALRDGATLSRAGALTNESLVSLGSDTTLTTLGGYTQTNSGLTRLSDETDNGVSPQLTAPTATFDSGRLEGNGTIQGDVVNNGAVVAPGVYAPGALTVTGNFTQVAGTLETDIHGTAPAEFDRIAVQGNATLAGGLKIAGHLFDPAWDDEFTVVTAASAPSMSFDLVEGTNLASGMRYQPKVVGSALKILVTDIVAPTNVSPTASHATSTWSKDNTVKVNLIGASDAHSGVDGYRVVWSTSPTTSAAGSKNVEENVAAVTSAPLASGKTHYVHIRTKDNEGRWSGQVNLGPFFIDTTAPTLPVLSTPATTTSYSLTTKSMVPQVGVVWKVAKDAHSGLKSHEVLYRSTANGTTWTSATVKLGAAATSWSTAGKPGTTYCFKVRAADNLGNTSVSAERCAAVPFDTGSGFTTAGTWTKPTGAAHYLGATSRSTATNATLTRKSVVAKQLALVATKCAGCGSVQVYFGGVAVGKVISLNTTSTTPLHKQVIPVGSLSAVKTGTLTVKVVSTGSKPVMIDAIGTSLR